MTEDEAKTKWCPMAMNNSCTRNPKGEIPDGAKCIGSDCMMFRVDHDWYDGDKYYCGLAGKYLP